VLLDKLVLPETVAWLVRPGRWVRSGKRGLRVLRDAASVVLVDQEVTKDHRDLMVVAARPVRLAQVACRDSVELSVPEGLGECAALVVCADRVAAPENWVSVAQLGRLAVLVQ